jgi:hypothetical protein
VTVAVAALGSGLIGALIGMHLAQRDADDRLGPFLSTPDPGRRATAYFDVAVGWHAYLESVRPLAFPTEGLVVDRPRDLAAVLRARAQLEQFGTTSAQRLHDDALEAAVALINVLRSLPKSPVSGQPDLVAGRPALRASLRDLAVKVDQLEGQMQVELLLPPPPQPPPRDSYVEITGRGEAVRRDRVAAPDSAAPAARHS